MIQSRVPCRCRLRLLHDLEPPTTTTVRKPPAPTTSVRNPTPQTQPIDHAEETPRLQFHMNNTCETTDRSTSFSSPVLTGEVAESSRSEGVFSSTDRSIHHLTNELLEDLQNPTLGSLELCQLHNLTLPELAAILDSESYQQAVDCINRITALRDKLLEPESKSLAKARLTDLLKTYPETDTQRETQRKAATTLLKPANLPLPIGGRREVRGKVSPTSQHLPTSPPPNPPTEPRPPQHRSPMRPIADRVTASKQYLIAQINRFRVGKDRFLWIMGETAPHTLRTGYRRRFRQERPRHDQQNTPSRRPDRGRCPPLRPARPSPISAN